MKTHWNTGRQYAAEGQPITAILDLDRKEIRFTDHARNIYGCIDCADWYDLVTSETELQRATLHMYDLGKYRNI